jgi:hypothetical protein
MKKGLILLVFAVSATCVFAQEIRATLLNARDILSADFRNKVYYIPMNDDSLLAVIRDLEKVFSVIAKGSGITDLRSKLNSEHNRILSSMLPHRIIFPKTDWAECYLITTNEEYGILTRCWNDTSQVTIMGVGPGIHVMGQWFFKIIGN